MVTMRDGVRLAADIYLPDGGAPAPVLLCRTPYDKDSRAPMALTFAEHGYVAVVQDIRGRHGSEGEFAFLHPEAEDGQDTAEWLAHQPFCDGRVGTWGGSFEGWAQTAMAAIGTKAISAMVPYMCGANGFTSSIRHGGALELRWHAWAFNNAGLPSAGPALTSLASFSGAASLTGAVPQTGGAAMSLPWPDGWLEHEPLRAGQTPLAAAPAYERMALDLLHHHTYDEFWAHPSLNPLAHVDRFPDAPALVIGGWYDSYTRGTTELYTGLAQRDPRTRLIIGPWAHCQSDQPSAGDVWFGEHAIMDLTAVHLEWFAQCFRQARLSGPPVRLFVMGGGSGSRTPQGQIVHGGQWRDEHEWPLARTSFVPYYLQGDGGLRTQPALTGRQSSAVDFDPAHLVPTRGGNVSAFGDSVPGGGFDQGQPGAHKDVLTFQSEPLTIATEVTGVAEVRLWVNSTAAGADFTAKLIDVYPDGFALILTDSVIRIGLSGLTEVTITLYPTSNLFAAGHRIRLDVASSNYPRFDLNPHGTAVNTIHHDAQHRSHLLLPIA